MCAKPTPTLSPITSRIPMYIYFLQPTGRLSIEVKDVHSQHSKLTIIYVTVNHFSRKHTVPTYFSDDLDKN